MGEPTNSTHHTTTTASYLIQSPKSNDAGLIMGGAEGVGGYRLIDSKKTGVVSSDAILAGALAPSQLVQVGG